MSTRNIYHVSVRDARTGVSDGNGLSFPTLEEAADYATRLLATYDGYVDVPPTVRLMGPDVDRLVLPAHE